jgi:hypothetical protein
MIGPPWPIESGKIPSNRAEKGLSFTSPVGKRCYGLRQCHSPIEQALHVRATSESAEVVKSEEESVVTDMIVEDSRGSKNRCRDVHHVVTVARAVWCPLWQTELLKTLLLAISPYTPTFVRTAILAHNSLGTDWIHPARM